MIAYFNPKKGSGFRMDLSRFNDAESSLQKGNVLRWSRFQDGAPYDDTQWL